MLKSEIEYNQVRVDGPLAGFRNIQDKNQQIQDLKNEIDVLCAKLKDNNIQSKECIIAEITN